MQHPSMGHFAEGFQRENYFVLRPTNGKKDFFNMIIILEGGCFQSIKNYKWHRSLS
jgi:hypothetical protein